MVRLRLIAALLSLIAAVGVASARTRTTSGSSLQEPVINRSAPMTLTGEIVDISCYKQKGVAGGTGAAHVECAKMCVLDQGRGARHPQRRRRAVPAVGHRWRATSTRSWCPSSARPSCITGTEVMLSNNYDVRSFDVQTIKPAKKTQWTVGQTFRLRDGRETNEREVIRRRRARRLSCSC